MIGTRRFGAGKSGTFIKEHPPHSPGFVSAFVSPFHHLEKPVEQVVRIVWARG